VAIHPLFVETHRSAEGMFDKPFQDFVSDSEEQEFRSLDKVDLWFDETSEG